MRFMLDIKLIREQPEKVKQAAQDKGVEVDVDKILELDKQKRTIQQKLDKLRADKNQASQEISKGGDKDKIIAQMKKVDETADKLEQELKQIEPELNKLLLEIPNLPRPDVKVGESEADNEVIRKWGELPKFDFEPKDHMELGAKLNLVDKKRAAKVSGSRFTYLKNEAVMLELALVKLAFDKLKAKGFQVIIPPALISDDAMLAMGYLHHGGEHETYHFTKDKLYLIGTSEQALGPMHMNEVLNEKDLPLRYAAFSPCFRREAGSYGKDEKGIYRVHEFFKVEQFILCEADHQESVKWHEELTGNLEGILKDLKIPHRVVVNCGGDVGQSHVKTYDVESWVPSENKYRESGSSSYYHDFQARRANIKFRPGEKGKLRFVHTLNGSGLAVGRTVVAIMENYQLKDGSIVIPEALRKYMDGTTKIG